MTAQGKWRLAGKGDGCVDAEQCVLCGNNFIARFCDPDIARSVVAAHNATGEAEPAPRWGSKVTIADVHVQEMRAQRAESELHRRYEIEAGNVWYWQGDGSDNPESLVCQVIIKADDLRALIKQAADPVAVVEKLRDKWDKGSGSYWRGARDFADEIIAALKEAGHG